MGRRWNLMCGLKIECTYLGFAAVWLSLWASKHDETHKCDWTGKKKQQNYVHVVIPFPLLTKKNGLKLKKVTSTITLATLKSLHSHSFPHMSISFTLFSSYVNHSEGKVSEGENNSYMLHQQKKHNKSNTKQLNFCLVRKNKVNGERKQKT